jgi:methylmalonyl-CoA carboxyltransferase large subunit
MTTGIPTSELEALIHDIRAELAALAARVALLETRAAPAVAAAEVTQPAAVARVPDGPPPIGEEELLAISAALAAYFGVRVHVRQIRLITSSTWAQQGRASIQASHRLF